MSLTVSFQTLVLTNYKLVRKVTLVISFPLQIVLSGSASIPENKQRGTKVGTFSSVDPNSKDKHTYGIVSGGSGKFELRGADLYTLTVFDYESSPNK